MSTYQFDKIDVLNDLASAIQANETFAAWASFIGAIDAEPDARTIASARRMGNFIMLRDNGAEMNLQKRSTLSDVWNLDISVAMCSPNAGYRMNDGMKTVYQMEDDMRQFLNGNKSFYSKENIKIFNAILLNIPPSMTVWTELYDEAEAGGFRIAIVNVRYEIYQRRR